MVSQSLSASENFFLKSSLSRQAQNYQRLQSLTRRFEMNESDESETTVSELVINVKTINNETHTITLSPHETVNFLKEKVSEVTGIEVDRQRLIYRGRVLVDEETIGSYSIESGHIVHMVAKPANYRELQQQASSSSSPTVPSSSRNVATATGPSTLPTNINNLQNATLLGGIQSPAIFQLPARTLVGQPPASVRQAMLESMARLQGGAVNMNPQSAPTESRQENSRSTNQDTQLENIRQGILTVNTLLSINNENSSEHRIENSISSEPDAATSDLPPWRRFYVGQWIDVKDTVQQWLEATIMTVDERRRSVFVHYNGWPQRWDEWIRWDSPRIAPFRSRTTHSVLTGAACPTPNVIPPHAQRTGVADVRTVIPELVRLYQSLQPMMTALAESVNDDLQHRPLTVPTINVAEGMPWQQYHSVPSSSSSPGDAHTQEQGGNDERTDTAVVPDEATSRNEDNTTVAEDSQDHLRQKYRDIIPLIDRFGRVLTDFSSLLWSEVDTYRPPAPANTLFGNAASQFSANSFEARLLNLLRERPPSPPPERAYQAPIHGIFRPTGSAGQQLDHHLDIHIAFLSPSNAAPAGSASTTAVPLNGTTSNNVTPNPAATTTAAVPTVAASSSLLTPTLGNNNAGAGELGSSTSLSRSVADLTTSLQQQAQQLARRTQELTERTSAVTEITHTLGEMLRSRREQLESLQQEQRQVQQASSSAVDASLPSPAISQSPVDTDPVYDEDQLSFDSSSNHSNESGHDAEDVNNDDNDDDNDNDDDSEDSRNERQFLEDLLLREYVQGGDAEDVENERLLDIEIDLLQHALHHHHHHHQQQQQQHHHLHSHRQTQHPLLEPQEVSGLLDHEEQPELFSEDTEDVLDAPEVEDDGGVGDVIREIMMQTEREMSVVHADKIVGENEGMDEKDSPVILEDLDAGLSRAMAAVSSTGSSLMPPSEEETHLDSRDDEGDHHQQQQHHRRHSKEPEPFYNLPNSRLMEDTNIYPSAEKSTPPPHVDSSTLVKLAEDIQHDGDIVASPSSPEAISPTSGTKATLEMLAYGEDDTLVEGTAQTQTDMPFVPHDTLVETDDFVEEHGAISSSSNLSPEAEDNTGAEESVAAPEEEDTAAGATAAQRRGSGMMMFH